MTIGHALKRLTGRDTALYNRRALRCLGCKKSNLLNKGDGIKPSPFFTMHRKKNWQLPTGVPLGRGASDPRITLALSVKGFHFVRRMCSHIYSKHSTPSWPQPVGCVGGANQTKHWFPLGTGGGWPACRARHAAPRRLNPRSSGLRSALGGPSIALLTGLSSAHTSETPTTSSQQPLPGGQR